MPVAKNILQSKTFWANIIGAAVIVFTALPAKYSAPGLAILNIIMRVISSGPVDILPKT